MKPSKNIHPHEAGLPFPFERLPWVEHVREELAGFVVDAGCGRLVEGFVGRAFHRFLHALAHLREDPLLRAIEGANGLRSIEAF